jgi:hypothetical protein
MAREHRGRGNPGMSRSSELRTGRGRKRGLIRWLRPGYQASETIQPLAKPLLKVEPEEEPTSAPAIEIQPWPKDIKEQLAALRGLLLGSDHLWSLQGIGDSFKSRGRYREGISTQLDLLADLGVITRVETAEGPAFHRPQAMGA